MMERREMLDFKEKRVARETLAKWVQPVQTEMPVPPVKLAVWVLPANLEKEVFKVHLVVRELKGQEACQGRLEVQENQVCLELTELKENSETQDLRVL